MRVRVCMRAVRGRQIRLGLAEGVGHRRRHLRTCTWHMDMADERIHVHVRRRMPTSRMPETMHMHMHLSHARDDAMMRMPTSRMPETMHIHMYM